MLSLNGTVLIEGIENKKVVICYKHWIGSGHKLAVPVDKNMKIKDILSSIEKSLASASKNEDSIEDIISKYWIRNDMRDLEGIFFSSEIENIIGTKK